MGKPRSARTWPRPRSTRHVWVKLTKHPHEPPRQGLVVAWRRRSYTWEALVIVVDDENPEPKVTMSWIKATSLRPVPADPNKAFNLR